MTLSPAIDSTNPTGNGLRKRRILVRGGSIAAGCGVQTGYVDLLIRRYPSHITEFINRSRPGETSFEGVETFFEDVAPYRPDILMLHFGIDDAYGAVYRSEFKENLVHIIKLAAACCGPAVFLLTSHPFSHSHEMEEVGVYYRAIREVALDLNCRLIPVHMHWIGRRDAFGSRLSGFVQPDPRLPNERGHRLFAEIVGNHLDTYMQERERS